jgi:prepilin-type N-terminal cleavage/methylation domain-containing protein
MVAGTSVEWNERVSGFTLLEMAVVLVIGAVLMGMATLTFANVNTRQSARRAAQVFSRDLALARSMAVRGREQVVIRFDEDSLSYQVETVSGRVLADRQFGADEDVNLSAIALGETGDSLIFSNRGIGTLSDSLGSALFSAGSVTYQVTFNAMGASQVGEI